MNDQTQAVLDKVDARELIDLASALIRIPSFKTEETAVALYLDRFFRDRGYDVDLQEIPCLLYGPGVIRGGADEDDSCVLVSEMVTVTRVLAVTALDVCRRAPSELALVEHPAP